MRSHTQALSILVRDADGEDYDEDDNEGRIVSREGGTHRDWRVSEALDWVCENLMLNCVVRNK